MNRAMNRWTLALTLAVGLAGVRPAEAGGRLFRRRAGAVAPTAYVENPANANAPSPMLGTFYPTPYAMIGGDRPTGNGYSPLGQYGINNMVMFGPTSIFRSVTAPVTVYSRGYDGRVYEQQGHSFSTPFRPGLSPVVYPTPNSYYYRPRGSTTSPIFTTGYGWIDQN